MGCLMMHDPLKLVTPWKRKSHGTWEYTPLEKANHLPNHHFQVLLLVEECVKPCKSCDRLHINWRRISSVNSMLLQSWGVNLLWFTAETSSQNSSSHTTQETHAPVFCLVVYFCLCRAGFIHPRGFSKISSINSVTLADSQHLIPTPVIQPLIYIPDPKKIVGIVTNRPQKCNQECRPPTPVTAHVPFLEIRPFWETPGTFGGGIVWPIIILDPFEDILGQHFCR